MELTNYTILISIIIILVVALIIRSYQRRDIRCSNCADPMKLNKASTKWVCITCKAEVIKK